MTKLALLIGVSQYQSDLIPLPKAIKDVRAMQSALQNPDIEGFDQVKTLLDPDTQTMREEIEVIFSECHKNDLVLMFFSGHGIKDDQSKLYFATNNTRKNENGKLIWSTAVSASFIQDLMSQSLCKHQVVILDCCFSGAFAAGMTAKDIGSVDIQTQLGGEGRAVLTSSTSTQYSFEQQESDLSIYSRYIVEGIATGAADLNNDGWIEVQELHEYAKGKVQETAPAMKPEIYAVKEGFKIRLAKALITDPKLKYRKEVKRYASRGDIPSYRRIILDTLREQLSLSLEEAAVVEDEVLRPYRERLEHLQRYREAFNAAIAYEYPLGDTTIDDLKHFQRMLGLRDEDIKPIEEDITEQFRQQAEMHQQKLVQYQHAFTKAVEKEFPISKSTRTQLNQLWQSLNLGQEKVKQIERPIVEQKAREYEQRKHSQTSLSSRTSQEQIVRRTENKNRKTEENIPLSQTTSIHQPGKTYSPVKPTRRDHSFPESTTGVPISNNTTTKEITRKQFLQLAGWGGGGLIVTLVVSAILKKDPRPILEESPQPLYSDTIKVGILHSLSGTMAISETTVVDAEMLAIDEINAAGGVLGKKIIPVKEDGASDWPTFAEKAAKLIDKDKVVTVFGCWTSASRKAVLPVFESKQHMLWYPVQYEGQECSNNIFYTGAAPNQQIEPAVDWLLENKGKSFFLVGSDYVFPRTANTIIKEQLKANGGKTVGEDYLPLGNTEVTAIITKIKAALPNGGVIFNSLNGDSNVAFFKQMQGAGLTPDKYPVMSVSIAEEKVRQIGTEYLKGHYAAWNYFQTVESPANDKFVKAFKAKYGEDRVTNDPMEAAYIMVYLWKQAVEAAGTTDIEAVRKAAVGQEFDAPEGKVKMAPNHHISKTVRIGQVRDDGLFDIVATTKNPVDPIPWNQYIPETKGYACNWTDPNKGGKYKF